jgi:penicillin amidase
VTPRASLSIQLDDRALFLERWKTLLQSTLSDAAVAGRADRAEMRAVLGHWSGRAAVDDPAYRFVRRFRQEVEARAFYMLIAPARATAHSFKWEIPAAFEGPLWQLIDKRPDHLLAARYASWDAFLLEAADAAAVLPPVCKTLLRCTWGTVHVTRVRHPLSAGAPALSGALDMPDTRMPGDNDMPRVIANTYGASERFSVSPGREQEAYFHMPGGQSGHPLSPYYRLGFDAWVKGEPTPFLPGPTAHVLRLVP